MKINRVKLIQLIHIAKSQMGMDADTYRQMLLSVTGKTSTSDMNPGQLNKVLAAMKAKGFVVKPSSKARTTRQLADFPQAKKLRALWLEMYAQGFVRDSSEEALRRWVKRETGVDGLQWLESDKASEAIEKLKKWQERELKKLRGET
ncbi:regulatory protein GemA [Salmonella enterica subsp. diarizonae]|uniref:Mu-like prophage protein gp16 n=1 Tax=Salmonella diarizonae TaxID=59204 RepID=A0A379TSF1_SALDZ|nr:regulatory protein GemA [Salmonella enterica]ECH9341110.1 regulatory protein GemA [Salmonella enterica subsp. diarizonae]EDU9901786.1 regulatory protein GemA [Salmonella enterica subsp. diarizonae]KAA8690741.1 regulatory protein GemA [Salmonella enterica subsp. diarizonae]SUG53136.1 Mu-like prophage protein gp16 [Salmonella enterica subsp. diarizonae]VFS65064.1 Mu-like prophage protein gp16 [Salmonella enterica subsp. diarizonae]